MLAQRRSSLHTSLAFRRFPLSSSSSAWYILFHPLIPLVVLGSCGIEHRYNTQAPALLTCYLEGSESRNQTERVWNNHNIQVQLQLVTLKLFAAEIFNILLSHFVCLL
jgi:hypothetical protein